LPNSVGIGKKGIVKINLSFAHCSLVFGSVSSGSNATCDVFCDCETAKQTQKWVHIHIMSSDGFNDVLTADGETLSEHVCPKKRFIHQAVGKLHLANHQLQHSCGCILDEDPTHLLASLEETEEKCTCQDQFGWMAMMQVMKDNMCLKTHALMGTKFKMQNQFALNVQKRMHQTMSGLC